jgi:hypothetical protein
MELLRKMPFRALTRATARVRRPSARAIAGTVDSLRDVTNGSAVNDWTTLRCTQQEAGVFANSFGGYLCEKQ